MQIHVVDPNNPQRAGVIEVHSDTAVQSGSIIKVYNEDRRNNRKRVFFVVKPYDRSGYGTVIDGDLKANDLLRIAAIRPDTAPENK